MILRNLEPSDSSEMLAWMHDEDIIKYMITNFKNKSLIDCEDFIKRSTQDEHFVHFAIASDSNEYFGTVSLKHIVYGENAEFAIVVKKSGHGKGYSNYAMKKIIEFGFKKLDLKFIYWSCNSKDPRANRFYTKNGYSNFNPNNELIRNNYDIIYLKKNGIELNWYKISKLDYYLNNR